MGINSVWFYLLEKGIIDGIHFERGKLLCDTINPEKKYYLKLKRINVENEEILEISEETYKDILFFLNKTN